VDPLGVVRKWCDGGTGGALQFFGTVRGANAAGRSAEARTAPESLTSCLLLRLRVLRNFKSVNELEVESWGVLQDIHIRLTQQ